MYETISIEQDNRGVATIWLDREEKRNALSARMIHDLHKAADALGSDESVRVVVLAARGSHFCAGGDLGWMREQFEADAETRRSEAEKLAFMLRALNTMPKPLIGRVQGDAYGGGVGLMSVCDTVVANEDAWFALTETRLGLIPATIGPYVCARMGEAKARHVFMSGRRFSAEEAMSLGLIAQPVALQDIDASVEMEVTPYLSCAPGAVARAKSLLRLMGPAIDDAMIGATIDELVACWDGKEAKDGIAAFFNRTPPHWAQAPR